MTDKVPPIEPIPPLSPDPNPDRDPNNPRYKKRIIVPPPEPEPSPTPTPTPLPSPIPGESSWSGMIIDLRIGFNNLVATTSYFLEPYEGGIREGLFFGGGALLIGVTAGEASIPLAGLRTSAARGALGGSGLLLGSSGSFAAAEDTPFQSDPILLDLNGDGIKTTNYNDAVFFDHDNNGFAEWSTWVEANDGILIRDLNNNGILDNGTEIFGNNTILSNGLKAQNGYEALADLDSNLDGIIDSQDAAFSELKILKGDGTVLTLQEANVKSLNLSHTISNTVDASGNTLLFEGSYTKSDNSLAQMGDFNLLTNTAVSNSLNAVTVSEEIAALPDALGTGNVYNLHQAMAIDTTGQLKSLIQSFIQTTDTNQQNALLEQILAKWAGVDINTNHNRGGMLHDTHAAIVEQFEGHSFQNSEESFIGTVPAGYISQAYYQLSETLYAKLMAVTQLRNYFSVIELVGDSARREYGLSLNNSIQMIQQLAQTDRAQAIVVAAQFSRTLNGLRWSLMSNYHDFYQAMTALGSDFKLAIDAADKVIISGTTGNDILGSSGIGSWDEGAQHHTRDARAKYLDGKAGNDILNGTYNSDVLQGGTGNDILNGYMGHDTYLFNAGDGQDTIVEGDAFLHASEGGFDSLQFGSGLNASDVRFTANGNDLNITFQGRSEQVTITGQLATDMLGYQVENFFFADGTRMVAENLKSSQVISGTSGDDSLTGTNLSESLSGSLGADYLSGQGGYDTLDGGDGNDILLGDVGNDIVLGGNGDDGLHGGVGNDTLDGQDGYDYILGEEGDDSLKGGLADDSLHGGLGNDQLQGQDGNDLLTGDEGNDLLLGGNGQDDLYSNEGLDTLEGGAGNDTLNGDLDSDTYHFEAGFGQDQLTDYSANAGTDVVSFGSSLLISNAVFTGDQFNNLIVSFQNSSDSLLINGQLDNASIETFQFSDGTSYTADQVKAMLQTLGTAGDDYLYGSSYAETLSASSGNDYIYAGIGDDTVDGGAGNDDINGAEGNDSLSGGTGADSMYGGLGNDIFVVDNSGDIVSESVGEGTDTVQSSITYTLGTNIENLTLTGTAAINATGNTLNNILIGNSANNTLNGNTGADSMYGGAGNDTYMVDHISDLVSETVNEGTDTVQSKITYTLTEQVENLTLTGAVAINGTGNILNNSLTGNSANNVLTGGTGNDTLNGAVGTDTLVGGTGNDTYVIDTTTDTLTENLNEGTDNVQSSVTYTLGNNLENLTLTGTGLINGTGNTLNNSLVGNAANNSLSGGAGNDTLTGGAGNDSLIGGTGNDTYSVDSTTDVITENASEGTDTVQSSVAYTLGTNLENLTLTGTAIINGTGNTLNNVLTGNSANNSLSGDAGNDTLNGAAGTDTLIGGTGNDTYVVDTTTDTLTENLNEGTDTVQSSVTYTLGNNLENLTLTGTGLINGTGNTLNNSLVGNAANNSLSGGSGNDTVNGGVGADSLLGGLGNDTFVVDNTGDVVSEIANEGTDTVQSSVTYTLGSNLENLTLTGTTAINGTGNTLNNILLGNTGNNSLNGGTGADTLTGDKGNDTLIGGTGNDLYQFKLGDGLDVIQENDSTAGNLDKVKFDSSIVKAKVAVFMLNGNLQIGYQGNTTDQITIQAQNTAAGSVERLELSDGYFMTNADVNQVIQNMTSYASSNGISLTSLSDVKNNQDLLNIVAAGWHT